MPSKKLNYILRPSLPRRAIVWFPQFVNGQRIEQYRQQHDRMALALQAHLTLVFPFHSRLTLEQLAAHAQRVVRAWPPFPVVLNGVWSAQSQFIGLATQVGAAPLMEMHDRLYRGPLAEFLRPEFDFAPHITLGRADTPEDFDALNRSASLVANESYRDLLHKITIIRDNGDNHWLHERDLYLNLA